MAGACLRGFGIVLSDWGVGLRFGFRNGGDEGSELIIEGLGFKV